jgi:hypothetical protein
VACLNGQQDIVCLLLNSPLVEVNLVSVEEGDTCLHGIIHFLFLFYFLLFFIYLFFFIFFISSFFIRIVKSNA